MIKFRNVFVSIDTVGDFSAADMKICSHFLTILQPRLGIRPRCVDKIRLDEGLICPWITGSKFTFDIWYGIYSLFVSLHSSF